MDRTEIENKKRSGRRYILIIMIAVAFVSVIGLSFSLLTKSVNDDIVRSNIDSMEELALHDQNSIRNSINLRFECMKTISQKLKVRKFADMDELFADMVKMAQSIPSVDVLSFLDTEGTEYASDGIVRKNSYLVDVCAGKTDSFVIRMNTSGGLPEMVKEVLFEAVPVDFTVDGHPMKWLICQFPIKTLENELKISSYEGEGYASVIDEEGYYIINMSRMHSFMSRDNFFSQLSDAKFEGYRSIEEVRAAAASGVTPVIYTRDGQKNIMVITAFDMADWYFIAIVPISVFEAQTRVIILRFILLLAIIGIILAAIIFLLYRQRRERERMEEEKRQRDDLERRKLIDGITSAYNIAYAVNMSNDTFEKLRMDDDIIGYEESFGNFTQAKEYFIRLLLPADRERMRELLDYNTIRRKLAENKSFDAEYRVPINNAMIWHTMNVTAIDKDTVTIGFAVNDLGITKKHIEEKRFSAYFALYEADLDTGMIKIIIDSPYYPVARPGAAVPYKAAMMAFSDSLDGEAKAFFAQMTDIGYIHKAFESEDKFSYTYRSGNLDEKWVDLTSFVTLRHADGTPAMFTLGFSYIDSFGAAKQELQRKIASQKAELEEALTFANFFLEPCESAYYIGLIDYSWKVYKRPGLKAGNYPVEENYLIPLGKFISNEVHPDSREALSILVNPEKLRAELSVRGKITLEFSRLSDGKWFRCYVIPGASDEYAALSFIDITREIEEQKKREKELTDAIAMADAASRAKTDFLFSMSHDIRTPMNAITGFTAMAKKYINDKSAVSDYLEKIDSSGKQLLSLVNNVLEMARIESGALELEENPVNIRQAFNATTTVLSEQALVNGQEFNYSLEGVKHFNVFSDEAKVSSITLNILSNSLKYTPEGGRIDFVLKEIPGRKEGFATYVLSVSDTGIGMSNEFLNTLFDPFVREKTSTISGVQGTGLGMAIVKRFVDLMGGDISVQSEPGKGTRFDVTLDFRINEEEAEESKKQAVLKTVSFKGLKALLVEDNELNREIALDILEEEGLAVDEAEDGSIAVEAMKEKGPDYYDFILMDIQMPVMNGYEATIAIREMYPEKHIPIIAVSANAFEEDRKASKEAGMDDHIAKPVNVRELFGTLAKYSNI